MEKVKLFKKSTLVFESIQKDVGSLFFNIKNDSYVFEMSRLNYE